MIIIDYIAYAILSIPVIIGLALIALMAIVAVILPCLAAIEELRENPKSAWAWMFVFLVIVSSIWIELRNRGIL